MVEPNSPLLSDLVSHSQQWNKAYVMVGDFRGQVIKDTTASASLLDHLPWEGCCHVIEDTQGAHGRPMC